MMMKIKTILGAVAAVCCLATAAAETLSLTLFWSRVHRYDVCDGGDDDDGDDDDDDDNGDDDNQLIYTESSIPRVMTGSLKFQQPFVSEDLEEFQFAEEITEGA